MTAPHNPIIPLLSLRHALYQHIRGFFIDRGYLEVETPIMVPSPGIDPYIDAIAVENGWYLATSPELQMKRLLGMGMKKIFQFTRAFRKGEEGTLHNPEFSLLEWYCAGEGYHYLMDEVESLVREVVAAARTIGFVHLNLPAQAFPGYTVNDLFKRYAGWIPSQEFDEERFFLDFIEKVEPHLKRESALIIYDFPAPLASLARINPDDPQVCERFELYLDGLEIANAFSELTDPKEQRDRFLRAQKRRKEMGNDPYPIDEKFLSTLESGLFPPCTGIALGLDRLIMAISGEHSINQVMAFPKQSL